MYEELGITEKTVHLINECDKELQEQFQQIDKLCDYNSLRVLSSFHKFQVSEAHFNATTGYGYNDLGRDTIEKIFADIFGCEDALVRSQFISGSHALTVCFFGLLRPGDVLLSICGKPYDTLDEVIGIVENASSLKSFGVIYDQIDLVDNDYKRIDKVGDEVGYYYLYKKNNNTYDVYRKSIQDDNTLMYLFSTKTIDSIHYINNYVYFINNNLLQVYADEFGVKNLIEYKELQFNKNLTFNVYSK